MLNTYFRKPVVSLLASLSLICSSVKYRTLTFLEEGLCSVSYVSCYFDLPGCIEKFLQCELIESTRRHEVKIRSPHIGIEVGQVRFDEVHHLFTHLVVVTNTDAKAQVFRYKG